MTPTLEGLAPLLAVFDMPVSLCFYRDVLGFEVSATSPGRGPDDFDWVLLEYGDVQLMLNTAFDVDERPATQDPARVAAHRDTTLYFGCRDLEQAYEYLREHAADLKPPKVAPYGMKQLYFTDPDGYLICFQWRAS